MIDDPTVLAEDDGRVRILRLHRPDARNAFNAVMYDEVRIQLERARDDTTVACVVVTGHEDAFCAGQDLTEADRPPAIDDDHGFTPFLQTLLQFDKPLLAAVNGPAIGVGLTMLLHFDLVLVSHSARMRAPFVGLGITTEAGSSMLLPNLVGWHAAAYVLMTGTWIDSATSVELGLAWRRVPDDELLDETLAVASEIATMPISSLQETKRLLLAARSDAVRAATTREFASLERLAGGPANREALAAFAERRAPDFVSLPGA